MIAIAGLLALITFTVIVFNATVYVLPFIVGLTVGLAANHAGADPLASLAVGIVAGVVIAVLARHLSSLPNAGLPIALVFATAAAFAGFNVSTSIAGLNGAEGMTRIALGCVGGLLMGGTAWRRLRRPVM